MVDPNPLEAALHKSVCFGQYLEVQSLLNEGVDPDAKDCFGLSPLMLAAERGHGDIVELLINSGADVHYRNSKSWSALHYASYKGAEKIVQALLNRGVDLHVRDYNGHTPLSLTVQRENLLAFEVLLKAGADINGRDNDGLTLLHYAACWKLLEAVKFLVNNGAQLDMKDPIGDTPLHIADCYGLSSTEATDYLLNAGANCNIKNNKGETPFGLLFKKICLLKGVGKINVETIKLCIEKGAYVFMDCCDLLQVSLKKALILRDVKLCSKVLINNFNNRDLPLLYKGLASSRILPSIDALRIKDGSGKALEVERAVIHEIQAKGFCNIFKMVPPVLSILCVKSFIEKLHSNPENQSKT